jgi:hypothetical protein
LQPFKVILNSKKEYDKMRQFKYYVKLNSKIVAQGITTSLKDAKDSFKGYGKNSFGSIEELNPDGTVLTEIGHKSIGRSLYCWE